MKHNTLSAVDLTTCEALIGTQSPFILVLHKGEPVLASILKCVKTLKIPSAALSGLGAFENPTIAYFDLSQQKYLDKTFPGIYELISLTGNITQSEGKPMAHIHVALGNKDYQVIGGHFKDALVGVTVEITITPLQNPIQRELDPTVGIRLIATR